MRRDGHTERTRKNWNRRKPCFRVAFRRPESRGNPHTRTQAGRPSRQTRTKNSLGTDSGQTPYFVGFHPSKARRTRDGVQGWQSFLCIADSRHERKERRGQPCPLTAVLASASPFLPISGTTLRVRRQGRLSAMKQNWTDGWSPCLRARADGTAIRHNPSQPPA